MNNPAIVWTAIALVLIGGVVLALTKYGPDPATDERLDEDWLAELRNADTAVIPRVVLEGEIIGAGGVVLAPDCRPAPFLGPVADRPEPDPLTAPIAALDRPLEPARAFAATLYVLAWDLPVVQRAELVGAS